MCYERVVPFPNARAIWYALTQILEQQYEQYEHRIDKFCFDFWS